jgi:hypothetical protein
MSNSRKDNSLDVLATTIKYLLNTFDPPKLYWRSYRLRRGVEVSSYNYIVSWVNSRL